MKTQKIGFIGLGLIGGSIAKSIKKFYPSTIMIAQASRKSTVEAAYADGLIINNDLLDINEFSDCDIIFLCSPVGVNVDYMTKLKDIINPNTLLTDVGSVKGDISCAAHSLGLQNQFIGGHPMAGAEMIGYEFSSDSLLTNAYYILTYEESLNKDLLNDFSDFISSLGCITMSMSPSDHDYATAAISHLPHVIAASLVNLVKNADNDDHVCKTIAAGGFKDITRISSSSPVMWQHICLTNKDEILHLMNMYETELADFRHAIETSDEESIISLFESAKNYRDSLTRPKVHKLVHELYTELEDKQGTIVACLSLLSTAQLSIKNIDIVHNRETEPGVFRIEFYDSESLRKASIILKNNGYPVTYRKE